MSPAMWGFLGLCLMMTLTPGLDTAMVMRNALKRGPGSGVLTALGCALGLFVHAAAVAVLHRCPASGACFFNRLEFLNDLFVLGNRCLHIHRRARPRPLPHADEQHD